MAHAAKRYFDSIDLESFRDNGDPCSGICMGADKLLALFDSIIMNGKDHYQKFIQHPFDGDILKYTEYGVSCGNSSCYHIRPVSEKSFLSLLGHRNFDVDFHNEIFDIVHDK